MSTRRLRQPHAALADLCDGFFDDLSFLEDCPRVLPQQLPPLAQKLLLHREHMTEVLRAHLGHPVGLRVLAEQRDGEHYGRRILLTPVGSERIVEVGIMRMELGFVPDAVQREVLARHTPLGEILMRHGILRRISPRWYFQFPQQTPIAEAFGQTPGEVYGRVGTIYCDEEPAIELLEVVSNEQCKVQSEE